MIPNKSAKSFVNQKYKGIEVKPLDVNFTSVSVFFFASVLGVDHSSL